MTEYINNLSEAIQAIHECRCSHFGTEHIREEHEGQLVWEGDVEIFQLEGHPDAKIAYGWGWDDGNGGVDYIGILKVAPIETAHDALKAAIISRQFK